MVQFSFSEVVVMSFVSFGVIIMYVRHIIKTYGNQQHLKNLLPETPNSCEVPVKQKPPQLTKSKQQEKMEEFIRQVPDAFTRYLIDFYSHEDYLLWSKDEFEDHFVMNYVKHIKNPHAPYVESARPLDTMLRYLADVKHYQYLPKTPKPMTV